jgi:hypothetical protein
MSVSDEAAEGVYWYEMPLSEAEQHWRGLFMTMEGDLTLTREQALELGVKAKALSSATPERLARLRQAFKDRFGNIPTSGRGTK